MLFYFILSFLILLHWLFLIKEALYFKKSSQEFFDFCEKTASINSKAIVSVVLAARDEELSLERALQSLVKQSYKNLEVIMIDDRSRDKTGFIMDKFSQKFPHFKKIEIKTLPPKWLGKTHALQQGCLLSKGEYLLFTDADVHFEPKTLEKTMSFLLEKKLDHLTLAPLLKSNSLLLSSLQILFSSFFLLFTRPSQIRKGQSYAGVGAFNLIKKSTYQKIGEHKKLQLEVLDDMGLGQLVVQNQFKSHIANGRKLLAINWYHSPRELLKGLEKNLFAGLNYSLTLFLLAHLFFFTVFYLPFLALFFIPDLFLKLCFLFNIIFMQMIFFQASRELSYSFLSSFITPLSVLLFHFSFTKSVLKILWKKEIQWRETSYPLQELKEYKKLRIAKIT